MYKKKRTILNKKEEWNEIMANEMCISVNVVAKLCDISMATDWWEEGSVCGIAAISGSWADTFILVTGDIK